MAPVWSLEMYINGTEKLGHFPISGAKWRSRQPKHFRLTTLNHFKNINSIKKFIICDEVVRTTGG